MAYIPSDKTKKIKEKGLQKSAEPFRFIMRSVEIISALIVLGGIAIIYFGNLLLGILLIVGALAFYGIEELFLQ